MSKILNSIKEHFGYNNIFSAYDLSNFLDINQKVISMILKKYSNTEVLGFYSNRNTFYLRTDSDILNARKKANEIIDKYDLKNKKYKIPNE